MDPYGSVWSLRTPWGLPGASWGPGGSKKGGKGVLTPGGARGALLGGLPISPSWANRPPTSLRGILTYMPLRAAYGLSEDPSLTTCFFLGALGWGYGISSHVVNVIVAIVVYVTPKNMKR